MNLREEIERRRHLANQWSFDCDEALERGQWIMAEGCSDAAYLHRKEAERLEKLLTAQEAK